MTDSKLDKKLLADVGLDQIIKAQDIVDRAERDVESAKKSLKEAKDAADNARKKMHTLILRLKNPELPFKEEALPGSKKEEKKTDKKKEAKK